jgi:hypothetical protein
VKTILYCFPPALALVLLAAHFFRSGNPAMWIVLALLVLFGVRRRWAARVLQVSLLIGAVEWLRTAAALIAARSEIGQPYLRLGLILGAVALFTALCSLTFQAARMRAWFRF